jgi:endonuclease/exonuclease/phosphatase family metal-dependent hydrolase
MGLRLKTGTFNILNSTDWYHSRRPLILNTITNMDCDVIGFQEVNFDVNGPDLQSIPGYQFIVGQSTSPITKAEFPDFKIDGNAALVKDDWTVESSETLVYDCQYRCALLIRLSKEGRKVLFVVTHLEWLDETIRASQVSQLLQRLEQSTDVPVVIAGDFNCYPDSISYFTMSLAFRSAYLEAEGQEPILTFPTGHTSPGVAVIRAGTVDYIWLRGPVSAASGRILTDFDSEEVFASDHYAVRVDLTLGMA